MINYIRNLRIRLKLYILIGVALIGMLIIGGMSFLLMGRINSMTSEISTSWLPSIDTARDLTATLANIRLNELGYLTAVSDDIEASNYQGGDFLGFARENILSSLQKAIQEQQEEKKIGETMAARVNVLQEISSKLAEELGREATVEELAMGMGMTSEEIKDIMKLAVDALSVTGEG